MPLARLARLLALVAPYLAAPALTRGRAIIVLGASGSCGARSTAGQSWKSRARRWGLSCPKCRPRQSLT